ncbi:MAG: hypothetical protein CM1200mP2_34700 [Planctomycetaceae bacterium]|nr:MAG: hypothetical protein CM1200mP2_34700 [Planctomycetaceae bacterium]
MPTSPGSTSAAILAGHPTRPENGHRGDPCPRCDGSLELARGIEVGHVFKLGTKYSTALSAEYLDENENKHPMLMGCYGIGINRIVAAIAETSFDDNGLIWPLSISRSRCW